MTSVQDSPASSLGGVGVYIVPVSIAIPATLVALKIIRYIYNHYQEIPGMIRGAKNSLVAAFTRQEGESRLEFKKRVKKNIFVGAACTVIFGAVITACVVCPFLVLPAYLAIPSAISGTLVVGDLLVNGPSYVRTIKAKLLKTKEFIKDAFTPRPGEGYREARQRIKKNIVLAALGGVIACGVLAGAAYGLSWLFSYMMAKNITPWNFYEILPFQTTLVIFLEYAVVGILHGFVALKKILKGDKVGAFFHLANFLMAFTFPLYYFFTATKENPMRLHYSIVGLLLLLIPFRLSKAVGLSTTVDSAIYFIGPLRGCLTGAELVEYSQIFYASMKAKKDTIKKVVMRPFSSRVVTPLQPAIAK